MRHAVGRRTVRHAVGRRTVRHAYVVVRDGERSAGERKTTLFRIQRSRSVRRMEAKRRSHFISREPLVR